MIDILKLPNVLFILELNKCKRLIKSPGKRITEQHLFKVLSNFYLFMNQSLYSVLENVEREEVITIITINITVIIF